SSGDVSSEIRREFGSDDSAGCLSAPDRSWSFCKPGGVGVSPVSAATGRLGDCEIPRAGQIGGGFLHFRAALYCSSRYIPPGDRDGLEQFNGFAVFQFRISSPPLPRASQNLPVASQKLQSSFLTFPES